MNIAQIRQTMMELGIPAQVLERFVFPETEDESPEVKVAFAAQMERLLSREQILAVMQEQGCGKDNPASAEFGETHRDKSVEERIAIICGMGMDSAAPCRINDDGTLTVYWNFAEDGKYRCVCGIIEKLERPAVAPLSFCGCCSGHIRYHYQNMLGVGLRLLETVSSPISSGGERHCEHLYEIVREG